MSINKEHLYANMWLSRLCSFVKENVSVQYSNQVMVALLELVTVLTN